MADDRGAADQRQTEQDNRRYNGAARRMQSAVALMSEHRIKPARSLDHIHDTRDLPDRAAVVREFKHQRVGINSAMSSHDALARLLIDKGVITADEYTAAVIAAIEREADLNAAMAREECGLPVNVTFS